MQQEKKKIVFFILSLTKGGAEHVVANMCNDYFVKDYNVTIVTCMKAPIEYPIHSEIKVVTLDKAPEESEQGLLTRFLRRRSALFRVLKEESPNLIISFMPEPNFIALSLRKRVKIPTIISVRNDPKAEYRTKARQVLMKHFYKRADYCVFQTEDARKYFSFSEHIQACSKVIPNPIDSIYLREENIISVSSAERRVILNIGRLEAQKDQKTLIEAFNRIADDYPDWNLEICGEGSLRDELTMQIENCQRTNRVFLCGNVDDIRGKMKNTGIFVLSSLYEGMPNALMEAMAMELPVISTDCPCGGPRMLIHEGEGILVPVGDTQALAEGLKKLLSDEDMRQKMGHMAGNIKKRCHPEKIMEEWRTLCAEYADI